VPGLRRGPRCPLAGEYTVITYDPRGISGSTIDDPEQDPWLAGDQPGRGSAPLPAMITGHVSVVCLPAGDAVGRMVVAVPVRGIVEGRGDPAAASSARGCSAAAQGAAEAFPGGPGAARCDPARPASQAGDDGDPDTVLR
jgi:hypothetical protein